MSKTYKDFENHIISLFKNSSGFEWEDNFYTAKQIEVAKPKKIGSGGECKTDVYVGLSDSNGIVEHEIKLTLKLDNADFLENKISLQRAKDILKENWQQVLIQAMHTIKSKFDATKKLYIYGENKDSEQIRITLGWRLEIANKPRDLSAKLIIPNEDAVNFIYRGTNLHTKFKDAKINDKVVLNSGIADFYFEGSLKDFEEYKLQDILKNMKKLDSSFNAGQNYLIFTANNYVFKKSGNAKAEKRDLCVYVNWTYDPKVGKLKADLNINSPLEKNSNDIKPTLLSLLKKLNLNTFNNLKAVLNIII